MTEIKRKIHIIGINSLDFKELSLKLQTLFFETSSIAAPENYIEKIKLWPKNNTQNKKIFFASKSDNNLIDWLKSQKKDAIVFSRGDPLWFGIGRILIENFPRNELNFYPSNTCIQLAFSKLKIPWQNTSLLSIHGRESYKLVETLKSKPTSLAIITDSKNRGLEIIKQNLFELKLTDFYEYWLCEDIGFENEKIRKLDLQNDFPQDISNLNIVVLLRKENHKNKKDIPLFGLNDSIFKTFEDRPNLLTKREIRIQILADLELPDNGTIWDIGAGCGSIGLEALKLRPNLKLICIDKRLGSKNLIIENARMLGVSPTDIYEGDIKNFLNSYQNVHISNLSRIIIGGCDKKTKIQIINNFSKNLNSGGIIALPLIDIEAINDLSAALKENDFEVNINLIQTYKSLSIAEGIRLDPNNPVFILKGKKLI